MPEDGCPVCGDTNYMGHEIRGVYDGVLYWVCAKCGHAWARFTQGSDRLASLSTKYATEWNERK